MPARVLKIVNENLIKWSIGFISVIVVQITFLRYFALILVPNTRVQPDLVLLLLFFFGTRHSQIMTTVTGFIVGFLLDALSGGMIGMHALTKTVAGFIIGYMPEAHKIQKLVQFSVFLFIVILLHDILFNAIYTINTEFNFWRLLFVYSLPSSIYTLFIGCLIFYSQKR
jgi:rod shape-determining protein MreD